MVWFEYLGGGDIKYFGEYLGNIFRGIMISFYYNLNVFF